jgi:AraC-like DNA-binding protein
MSDIQTLGSIEDLNTHNGRATTHPLVTVLDLSKSEPGPAVKLRFELYGIFLKESTCHPVKYGRTYYDYQRGTLVFVAPGQVVELEAEDDNELHQPSGWVLFFHPDLIRGTPLGQAINGYTFFGYQVNEALHLSDDERRFVQDCFARIQSEIERPVDKHSRKLIASAIELLLNYCVRFYDRQFILREQANHGVLHRFERLLNGYFDPDQAPLVGLPSVAYFAKQLALSPKYFSDVVKKETGKSALEFIQFKLIELAKERLFDPDQSISEIAYGLGFKYPQHFTRLFRQKVGMTPQAYRSSTTGQCPFFSV